jgi:RecA/RadA recombinase
MITFTGDSFGSTDRILTACHSLDLALQDRKGNTGYPLKSLSEVYGNKGVGKSTFCFSLMGMIASKLQKNIVILDWEGQSRETIEGVLERQNFMGSVEYVLNRPDEQSEDTVERFLELISDDEQNVGLVDSIGGFLPTAYLEGKIGDSSMGVFARETGRMVNKAKQLTIQSENPGAIFMTNHVHPTIGSMVQGQDTSGGVKKKYLSHVRIDLKRAYIGNSSVSFPDGWLLKGRVDDNRYGYSKREFYVFMMAGEGIHVGLTALWDCVLLGYAELSAKSIKDSVVISMEGTSYGKMRNIIKESPEFFAPFINRLREGNDSVADDEEVVEESPKKGKKK